MCRCEKCKKVFVAHSLAAVERHYYDNVENYVVRPDGGVLCNCSRTFDVDWCLRKPCIKTRSHRPSKKQ